MNKQAIIKTITRQGYYIITEPYEFNLGLFQDIKEEMPLEILLDYSKFEPEDWVIFCPEILSDRHNCFWHGQGVDVNTPISDPTYWIVEWQNRRQTNAQDS